MSLINEALKKARAESAQEEARRRGAAYTGLPLRVDTRPARRWLVPALVGAVVALLVASAVAVALWSSNRGEAIAGVAPASPPVEAPAAPAAPEAAPLPAPVSPAPAQSQTQPPPAPVPTTTEAPPAPAPEPVAPAVPASAPAPAPPAPEPAGERSSFARIARLPGGVELELEFIVWSEKPFAQVNDNLIEPGESIAGYRLVAVEREKVIFEGPQGEIEITVR